MSLALVLLPGAAGVLAFVLRSYPARRALLILAALGHALLVGACWLPGNVPPVGDRWLAIDPLGLIFLSIASLLFLAASVYAVGYLEREAHGRRPDFEESGVFFANVPEAIFIGGLLLFLATLSLAALSQHFGLLWVGMEATTLATAPLIYFHRHHRSLEAAWKYLLICSVGIGIALLGNFVLAVAAEAPQGEPIPLVVGALAARAGEMDRLWLRAAFLFFIVGYGTKMGLAPLHTWLPDAHSECPSVVSALLSGALLNVALLGILRAQQVLVAAGEGAFGRSLLLGFGVLSVFVAAVFVLGQPDYKRLLAYSSVEHVGILALGLGLGPWGAFPALYHAINHSLAKAMLFFVSGNILAAYRTKEAAGVRGVLHRLPASGVLWIAGFLAISGVPPFGTFFSKYLVLAGAFGAGRPWLGIALLALLALIFAGMGRTMLGMAYGTRPPDPAVPVREPWLAIAPPAVLLVLLLVTGLALPDAVRRILAQAVRQLDVL